VLWILFQLRLFDGQVMCSTSARQQEASLLAEARLAIMCTALVRVVEAPRRHSEADPHGMNYRAAASPLLLDFNCK